jgi:hypothetical protein
MQPLTDLDAPTANPVCESDPMRAILLLMFVAVTPAAGQTALAGQAGPRRLLPRADEIALARSAAPRYASQGATVWVLTEAGYVVAERGTTGVACYVSRSWIESIEPHCFDEEGARSIMRIEMRRVELRHQGAGRDVEDREIAAGLASGRFQLPRRPVLSWMLSGAQRLISDDGAPVGKWRPHLMIYYPYLTAVELGLDSISDLKNAVLVDGGTATSSLMIVTSEFVQPESAGSTPR